MFLLFSLLFGQRVFASPPVTDADKAAIDAILSTESDGETFGRLLMVLSALEADLSEGALFYLATTHPQFSEMILTDRYRYAMNYLLKIPAFDRGRLRQGETILREVKQMSKLERLAAQDLAKFMGHNPKKLRSIRIGAFRGFMISMEIASEPKRKELLKEYVDLAWPSTPIRDERSREILTKHFKARPSPPITGPNARILVADPSFEKTGLNGAWKIGPGIQIITDKPESNIEIDTEEIMDGEHALRFYATDRTRSFPSVSQTIPIPAGQMIRLRVYVRASKLRLEFKQSPNSTRVSIRFLDANGEPVAPRQDAVARLGSYEWELMEIKTMVPANATQAEIKFISGQSGTVWFDGLSLNIVEMY